MNSVDELLAKIDVTSRDFGEVRDNMAGFVVKSESDSFTGISLSTDVKSENLLTSGKVRIYSYNVYTPMQYTGIFIVVVNEKL